MGYCQLSVFLGFTPNFQRHYSTLSLTIDFKIIGFGPEYFHRNFQRHCSTFSLTIHFEIIINVVVVNYQSFVMAFIFRKNRLLKNRLLKLHRQDFEIFFIILLNFILIYLLTKILLIIFYILRYLGCSLFPTVLYY